MPSNQVATWRRVERAIWARCDREGREPTEQESADLWRARAIKTRLNEQRRARRERAAARAKADA